MRMDGDAMAGLLILLLVAAVVSALMMIVCFAGPYLAVGLAINFIVRLLIGWLYRANPVPARQLLGATLGLGVLVLPVVTSAAIYPEGARFLGVVGFFIALAGYYSGHFLYEMAFESEAAMRAEQRIIAAEVKIWMLKLRCRLRFLELTVVDILGKAMWGWRRAVNRWMTDDAMVMPTESASADGDAG